MHRRVGRRQLNDRGEPIYGDRDVVALDSIAALGLPFWLAGSYGSAQQVSDAIQSGAAGVQVGTAFAFCEESGFLPEIKERVLQECREGKPDVVTDALASPTGFPFKVLQMEDSISDQTVYENRQRVCDLGFLRQGYRKPNGTIGWRCPSEPVKTYLNKGGDADATAGRKCVCNGLLVNIGMGQRRKGRENELPLVTCGDDVGSIPQFLPTPDAKSYSASDVIERLLAGIPIPTV